MKFRASCLLVFIAVTWVSGLDQEDGGTYVKPKQGGVHVDPKQSCGGKLTVDENGVEITSPGYPNDYSNDQKCTWRIKADDPDATLDIECNDIDVNCRGDKILIVENRKVQEKFCGTGDRSYSSEGNRVVVKFRTNKWGTKKGFSCLITASLPSTETSETSSVTTTATSDTRTCECGVSNPNRIVGGQEVDPRHKYPWQVGMKFRGGKNYWCGGSIINDRYVLTAAHCIDSLNGNTQGLVVGVADHNMYSSNDDVSDVTRLVDVVQIIQHPDYNSDTLDNDIALLKLSEPLDLSQHKQLRAVCLPADDSNTYAGMMAIASGWGTLKSNGLQPAELNEVALPILEPSCWGMGVTKNMLCAGLRNGGKDTCQGDSGGPLFVEESSKKVQVGIVSWGYGCADPNSPGVYARVSKFLPWIKDNTADATYCQ